MLIAFAGRKGSGKDVAAGPLIKRGYVNVKFADTLKNMLRSLLADSGVDAGTIDRMIEGDLKEVPTEYLQGKTPRHAMQTLGTDWGRDMIGDALWTDATKGKVAQLKRDGLSKVVITDMRFPNEVDTVKELGGQTVLLQRPSLATDDAHISEVGIDYLDTLWVIENCGTIEDLEKQATTFLEMVEKVFT